MFNFDEAKVLQEHKNGLSIVGATEKAVDEVIKRGYKNIFYRNRGNRTLCQPDGPHRKGRRFYHPAVHRKRSGLLCGGQSPLFQRFRGSYREYFR